MIYLNLNKLCHLKKVHHLLDHLNERKCLLLHGTILFLLFFRFSYIKFISRAHPNAPNKPPFETVAGLMAAPLDKLRDLFEKFPETK